MAQAPQNFTHMFKNLGEQLKLPQVDVAKIMQHHQKNLDAMARSWQAMASGASEFAKKAMEAAIANTRDIAEVVQKSSSDGFKIVQDRMKESYDEIKASVEKKP